MDQFPYVARDHVRLRDVDTAGHVNNSVYLTYIEQARVAIFGYGAPFVLARLAIDFREPARFDEEIEVHTRTVHVGSRSIELEHRITADGRLVAEATGVVVAFDRARRESMPVPAEWRERLAAGAQEPSHPPR